MKHERGLMRCRCQLELLSGRPSYMIAVSVRTVRRRAPVVAAFGQNANRRSDQRGYRTAAREHHVIPARTVRAFRAHLAERQYHHQQPYACSPGELVSFAEERRDVA